MILQLALGMGLIVLTVMIHAIVLDRLIVFTRFYRPQVQKTFHYRGKEFLLAVIVLGVCGAHILEIWVWAFAYLFIDEIRTLEAALYYSISTFTTVGYGDIVLSKLWRVFSSIEAANGMLLFGWSTAFIFEVMRRVWESKAQPVSSPGSS